MNRNIHTEVKLRAEFLKLGLFLLGTVIVTNVVKISPRSNSVESSWNVMAHGDAREGKWRGNWRMEWVASTLHTTSEHGVSSITTADVHTSAASSRLNWHPCRIKWTRPFRRKTKSGFCACAVTFQTQSTILLDGSSKEMFPRRSLMMQTESVSETVVYLRYLTWVSEVGGFVWVTHFVSKCQVVALEENIAFYYPNQFQVFED
jgi:hypothetical protein